MAKKIITQKQLHDMITESVMRVLAEAGNIYTDNEDGSFSTNASTPYRGVADSVFIWHGEWSDPEIYYGGYLINSNDVEDMLWYRWKDYAEEEGLDENDGDAYETFANEHAEDALSDCIFALSESGVKPVERR